MTNVESLACIFISNNDVFAQMHVICTEIVKATNSVGFEGIVVDHYELRLVRFCCGIVRMHKLLHLNSVKMQLLWLHTRYKGFRKHNS